MSSSITGTTYKGQQVFVPEDQEGHVYAGRQYILRPVSVLILMSILGDVVVDRKERRMSMRSARFPFFETAMERAHLGVARCTHAAVAGCIETF